MGFGDILKVAAPIVGGAVGFVATGFNPAGAAAGAGLGLGVSGTVSGMEAEESAKDAAKDQRRLARLENRRNRLELVRQYQVAQAQSAVLGEASGAGIESSRRQGTASSLGAQVSGNLQFNDKGLNLSNSYYDSLRDAYNASTQANLFNAGSALALQASRSIPTTFGGGTTPNKTTPVYTAPRSPQAAPTDTNVILTPRPLPSPKGSPYNG